MKLLKSLLSSLLSFSLLVSCAHADETISQGLTLVIPSQGARNWGTLFKDDFATPISSHDHTGGGAGSNLVTNSYSANSVTGAKIRLANAEWLRARNAANSADVNLLRLNGSNLAEFGADTTFSGAVTLSNATITTGDLTGISNFAGTSIGSDLQAWDADLDTLAGLAKTDSNFIVGNGSAWVAESGDTVRTSLGLAIGTNVQAYDADLTTIGGLSKTDGNVIVADGAAWTAESGATARASLGLEIGGDVEAHDADLTVIGSLAKTANTIMAADGATWAGNPFTYTDFSNGDMCDGAGAGTCTGESIREARYVRIGGMIFFSITLTAVSNTPGSVYYVDAPVAGTAMDVEVRLPATLEDAVPGASWQYVGGTEAASNQGFKIINFSDLEVTPGNVRISFQGFYWAS